MRSLRFNHTRVRDPPPPKGLAGLRLLELPDGRKIGGPASAEDLRREVQGFLGSL